MMGDPEKKRKENEKSEARRIHLNRFIRVEVLVIRCVLQMSIFFMIRIYDKYKK